LGGGGGHTWIIPLESYQRARRETSNDGSFVWFMRTYQCLLSYEMPIEL
jgi:hypothetical protein